MPVIAPINTVHPPIGERVQCRIHGVWFWLPLIAQNGSTATIDLDVDGKGPLTRELPILPENIGRFTENCVIEAW